MKTPLLTLAQANELLTYFHHSGDFFWNVDAGRAKKGDSVGTIQHGYKKLTILNEQLKLHRVAWFMFHKVWPNGQIDHIDGNKLNNRISNLRDVSMSVNMQNRYATKTKKSGLPYGVRFSSNGKYKASIMIGTFDTADEASEAYMRVKRIIHEGCTR